MMYLVFLLGFYLGGLLMCAIGGTYYLVALRNDDYVSKKLLIIAILVWPISVPMELHEYRKREMPKVKKN